VLMVRPRGWHLDEKHVVVDGKPVPGGLFDFGLYFFHNAHQLLDNGSGPYFYLPKMESHLEARLWNDVFKLAQDELGLPHGTIKDGNAEGQPVWLTAADDNPNHATVRFLADGADLPDPAGYARVVMLFDGQDPDAVDRARAAWKTAKAAGHDATYWQQSERGRWEKKG
ncbi:MAG: hypothetical protein F9K43_30340, partial [Bauldia sp.]